MALKSVLSMRLFVLSVCLHWLRRTLRQVRNVAMPRSEHSKAQRSCGLSSSAKAVLIGTTKILRGFDELPEQPRSANVVSFSSVVRSAQGIRNNSTVNPGSRGASVLSCDL